MIILQLLDIFQVLLIHLLYRLLMTGLHFIDLLLELDVFVLQVLFEFLFRHIIFFELQWRVAGTLRRVQTVKLSIAFH